MKQLLLRPRSIAGATIWGTLVAFGVFFGLIIANFIWSYVSDDFGPPHLVESVAVGGGYSISIQAKPIHPFLAEYEQVVSIYGGDPRDGNWLGTVEIPTNTGGRVRVGVLVPGESSKHEVVLLDRYAVSRIDLEKRSVSDQRTDWKREGLEAIGWFSGESYPLKFIPCSIWPRLSQEEQQQILDHEKELESFCDR